MTSSPRTPVRLADIRYRRATWKDHALLRRFREECGWGIERMERDLDTPEDTPLWVFSLDEEQEQDKDARLVDFGMGGHVVESTIEPLLASRATGSVKLTSLFITPTYQNLGLGKLCLDLLEKLAIDEFNAKWLTLDTRVHGSVGGVPEGRDDERVEATTLAWYRRRGYEEFLERIPKFERPQPDDPGYKLLAAFMRRPTGK